MHKMIVLQLDEWSKIERVLTATRDITRAARSGSFTGVIDHDKVGGIELVTMLRSLTFAVDELPEFPE